jgi:hypothetical protein
MLAPHCRGRAKAMVRRHAGALFVFDYIDVGDDTAARYRPTRRTKCDRPTAEIFECLYRACLIAKERL